MRKNALRDLPLVVKMGAAPTVALVMLVLLTATAIYVQGRQSTELQNVVQQDLPNSVRMQRISERISNVHGQLYLLLTHKAGSIDEAKIPDQMDALLKEIDSISAEVVTAKGVAPEDQRKSFDQLLKSLKDTRGSVEAVGAIMTADFATAAGFVAPFEDQYQSMGAILSKLVDQTGASTRDRAAATYNMSKTAQLVAMIAAGLALLIVGGIGAGSLLPLRRAIMRIAGATEKLADGDTQVNLDQLARGDELGAIVRSLTVFRDHQTHLDELRKEQEVASRMTDEERRRNDEIRAQTQREQAVVVEGVAEGLENLAKGDLTFRLLEPFVGDYEKLRADFNGAMEQMQDVMKVIASNAQGMRGGAGEISQAADDLSRRTEQQAATLEQTAAAMDEITATVKKTAEGAAQANTVVAQAKTDAEKGGSVVREAVSAMGQIEQSSQKIGQIIGVIDEIAFQTNLLALNAGVEAARAGDAGRGFAVVASEVRGLAQRSAEAAKEIKALISASSQQVKQGVDLVGQTGGALDRIISGVGEIKGLVSDIAASAQEQAIGLSEVNTAINQMDQTTQQNAAMVEQSTAASHGLAQETEELVRLMGRFRTGAEAEIARANQHGARAAEPGRQRSSAPTRPSAGAHRPATALKPLSQTRPAETPAEDWEEF
jgi:methyl-accepting chemotaxis protein